MATTTNFGWETPDDTDLVKDGAAAIRTALGGVDTSFVDLKGGTTGQILSKASNTDLDFVWTADAGAPTSLGYAAGKNKIINGDFNVWQRGTSISATNTYAYISDRWQSLCDGAITGARTAFTPGTAPIAGYEGKYYLRYTKTSGTYWQIQQYIEDVQTLAGQTATISFWAKVDSAKTIYIQLSQNFGSGGSSTVTTSAGTQALTTSWARYTFTVSVPSISGKTIGTGSNLALEIGIGATTGNITFDIWGVQVENGSTATSFQTATGTIQGELAACQRYFYKKSADSSNAYSYLAQGTITSATNLRALLEFPVAMRTSPTVTKTGNMNISTAGVAVTSVTIDGNTANGDSLGTKVAQSLIFAAASGLTVGQSGYVFANNDTTANLSFSAEL